MRNAGEVSITVIRIVVRDLKRTYRLREFTEKVVGIICVRRCVTFAVDKLVKLVVQIFVLCGYPALVDLFGHFKIAIVWVGVIIRRGIELIRGSAAGDVFNDCLDDTFFAVIRVSVSYAVYFLILVRSVYFVKLTVIASIFAAFTGRSVFKRNDAAERERNIVEIRSVAVVVVRAVHNYRVGRILARNKRTGRILPI